MIERLIVLADGLAIGVGGRVELILLQVDIAQAGIREGVVRIQRQRLLDFSHGRVQLPLLYAYQAQVEARRGVILTRQGRGIGGGGVIPLPQALVRMRQGQVVRQRIRLQGQRLAVAGRSIAKRTLVKVDAAQGEKGGGQGWVATRRFQQRGLRGGQVAELPTQRADDIPDGGASRVDRQRRLIRGRGLRQILLFVVHLAYEKLRGLLARGQMADLLQHGQRVLELLLLAVQNAQEQPRVRIVGRGLRPGLIRSDGRLDLTVRVVGVAQAVLDARIRRRLPGSRLEGRQR